MQPTRKAVAGRKAAAPTSKTQPSVKPGRPAHEQYAADLVTISTTVTEIKEEGRELSAFIDRLTARIG